MDQPTRTGLGLAGAGLEAAVLYFLLTQMPPPGPPPPPPGKIAYRSAIMTGLDHSNPSTFFKFSILNTLPKYNPIPGDFILASLCHVGGTYYTISPPLGWTLIRRDDIGMSIGLSMWGHFYEAGELDFTFRFQSSTHCGGVGAIYSNVHRTSPVNVVIGITYPSYETRTIIIPSITTTVQNAELVAAFLTGGMTGFTTPAEMTHIGGFKTPLGLALDTFRQSLTAAGPTGSKSSTYTDPAMYRPGIGQMVALSPP